MSSFQNILALDTALGGVSAAVVTGESLAVRSEVMARGQAEHLVPFAQQVMGECALDYKDLDAIICTIGPGAFTGLRIGISTARAFGLSLGVPVFGITTFDALALKFCEPEKSACSVILETKRKDFYFQHFDKQGQAVSKRSASEKVEIPEGSVLIGDGVSRFVETATGEWTVDEGYDLPDMAVVAKRLQERGGEDTIFEKDAAPVYLRDADVSQPKVPPRKLAQI